MLIHIYQLVEFGYVCLVFNVLSPTPSKDEITCNFSVYLSFDSHPVPKYFHSLLLKNSDVEIEVEPVPRLSLLLR